MYTDSLAWDNWSWNTAVSDSSYRVYSGSYAMRVQFNSGGAALYAHTGSFSTAGFSDVTFWFYRDGSSAPSGISAALYDSGGSAMTSVNVANYDTSVGGGWYRIDIPLADLNGVNKTITGFRLLDTTGSSQSSFRVDDLYFHN